MKFESEVFGTGSTIKWGFSFKEHADSEDVAFVLMVGESSILCLDDIGASFAANQWAAKAICDAYKASEEGIASLVAGMATRYAISAPGANAGSTNRGDYIEHNAKSGELLFCVNGTTGNPVKQEAIDSLIKQLYAIRKQVYGTALVLHDGVLATGRKVRVQLFTGGIPSHRQDFTNEAEALSGAALLAAGVKAVHVANIFENEIARYESEDATTRVFVYYPKTST